MNLSRTLLSCCAVLCCATSALADDAKSKPTVACCGREAAESRPVVGRDPASESGTVSSDLSNCVCLKYIYAYWGDGGCSFYATDCFGSPFSWNDFCDSPYPGNCDPNSCGTCLYIPEMPAPRGGRHDRPASATADHRIRPKLTEESGATFFEEPFFVQLAVPGRAKPLHARVFPILVPRKEAEARILPAQVFYPGIEIDGIPDGAVARQVRGDILGAYGCRAVDYERVLQIRTHTRLTD